uniref:HMA domain-containing protein n=3 Tax=Aegilops tauschii TaxID=37682 RepID=A0A453TDK5_AEGTS
MSKKILIRADLIGDKCKSKILATAAKLKGIKSMDIDQDKCTLTVVGTVDPVRLLQCLRKSCFAAVIISVADDKPKEPEKKKDPCQEACEKACKDKCEMACKEACCKKKCEMATCNEACCKKKCVMITCNEACCKKKCDMATCNEACCKKVTPSCYPSRCTPGCDSSPCGLPSCRFYIYGCVVRKPPLGHGCNKGRSRGLRGECGIQ